MKQTLDKLLAEIEAGRRQPVYLVAGDLVTAEPQAVRVAEAVARQVGCAVESNRRPSRLGTLFADLRTFSLFGSAKVVLVVDSALLADTAAAAELIDQAAKALPIDDPSAELSAAQREGASRLMQALHVFGVEEVGEGDAASLIDGLPKWAVQGGAKLRKQKPRGRSPKEMEKLRTELVDLLEAGRAAGLVGAAEGDLAELGELVAGSMPDTHCLVMAESSVAKDHPLRKSLVEKGAFLETARIQSGRRGWEGLGDLAAQLEDETGIGIDRPALDELARRTLRGSGDFRDKSVDRESTGRLAGEYRKLASLVQGRGERRISRPLVEETIKDRGEEDVWKILDAIGEGRAGEAISRYKRLIEGSSDQIAQRLSFFALLATFCRQLAAVAGVARSVRAQPGVRSYNQFKDRVAPKLQGALEGGVKNPLGGLHPFRLHRAYLAASRIDRDELMRLPWRVLETEMQVKGEASDPDTAVIALISHLVASRI